MCFVRATRDVARQAARRGKRKGEERETRQQSIHLPPRAPAALTSISASAGPEPAALGAAGAAPPSGLPLLPRLLPPAPAAEGLEGALSGGGGGGGSAADDMFRLRHPPRPRAGAAPREAAWACAALASEPPGGARPARKLSRAGAPPPTRAGPAAPLASSSSSAGLCSTGVYPTAGITSTRVGGASGVTEVREGGLPLRRRRAEGKGKESERYGEASRRLLLSRSRLSSPTNQDGYLRHPLSSLARALVSPFEGRIARAHAPASPWPRLFGPLAGCRGRVGGASRERVGGGLRVRSSE